MSAIPTVPATAPPTSATQSGSPAAERAGGQGDFAATLTDIATARTAPAEGHKETDRPAADDQSTGADRQPEQQPALDTAPVTPAPVDHDASVPSSHDDADRDDVDAAPAPSDGAASALPMVAVLALTAAALETPITVASVTAATPAPAPAAAAPAASEQAAVAEQGALVPAAAAQAAPATAVAPEQAAPAPAAAEQPAPAPAPAAAAPAPSAASTDDTAVAPAAATQQAPLDPAVPAPPPAQPAAPAQAFAPAQAPTLAVRADHVRAMLRVLEHRGQVQAQLTLHPAELGGVEVRLRQTAHGLMATVTADRADAAHVLQQAGSELRRALEAQGVQVAGLDIGTAGENQDTANARANERRAESALAGSGRDRAGADDGDNDPSPIDPDHRTTTASTIALGALVDVLA